MNNNVDTTIPERAITDISIDTLQLLKEIDIRLANIKGTLMGEYEKQADEAKEICNLLDNQKEINKVARDCLEKLNDIQKVL